MKTCPPQLYQTDSLAEEIIFCQLKQAFNDKVSYVAMHSVQLTHHSTKRFAEIDFLLCTNVGLFILEVKGGQVSCQSGMWYYQDKYGHCTQGGSPFHQAHLAMQGLKQSLLKKFDRKFINQICFGYGVIFTDTKLPNSALMTVEYDKAMLCHGKEYRYLQKWLQSFFDYWYQRNKNIVSDIQYLTDEQLQNIIEFIRPNFNFYADIVESQAVEPAQLHLDCIEYFDKKQNNGILKNQLQYFLVQYCEKTYEGYYFSARDITIVIDDRGLEQDIITWVKQIGFLIRVFDEYSFNFRKSYELSLIYLHSQITNKIVIGVFEKNAQNNDWQEIKKSASHIFQLFSY